MMTAREIDLPMALRALADPLRLRLLAMLRDQGETCVCELLAALGTSQSNVSMHLRVLREAGLIRGQRRGRWVFYTLDGAAVEQLLAALGAHLDPAWAVGGRSAVVAACCEES